MIASKTGIAHVSKTQTCALGESLWERNTQPIRQGIPAGRDQRAGIGYRGALM
ncbi:MAG: hypothetical protein AAGJ35_11495 [Myxococcota bacterium]